MTQAVITLYDKLGGRPAVQAVVGEFYKRVLADVQLKGFFAHTDMDQQIRQQIRFVSMALGGPGEYDGRSMKKAHKNLGISQPHFDLVAIHLVGALKWAGVEASDIDAVIEIVAPLRDDIVTV